MVPPAWSASSRCGPPPLYGLQQERTRAPNFNPSFSPELDQQLITSHSVRPSSLSLRQRWPGSLGWLFSSVGPDWTDAGGVEEHSVCGGNRSQCSTVSFTATATRVAFVPDCRLRSGSGN